MQRSMQSTRHSALWAGARRQVGNTRSSRAPKRPSRGSGQTPLARDSALRLQP